MPCIFGSRTFVILSWMCKKQTSFSYNSTESEVLSSEASLRMDGSPALDLWCLVFEVLHPSLNQPVQGNLCDNKQSRERTNTRTKKHSYRDDLNLISVDHVTTNTKLSHFGAFPYISEDSEAAIKMIVKGRSPTIKHVSRTRKSRAPWLFDRINLDPKIQIKHVDTKSWLAHIHSDERQFHPWRVEPPSPFVQQHGHFTVFIKPFQLNQLPSDNAEQANTARKTRRRWTSGCEIKNQCGIWCRRLSICFQLCRIRAHKTAQGINFGFIEYGETCCDGFEWEQRFKFSSVAHRFCPELKKRESCCEIGKEHHRSKSDPSNFDHTAKQSRVYGHSRRTRTTETWSSEGRQNGAGQHQRNDLGNIYDCVHESSGAPRRRLWRKFTCHEEHRTLRDSALVLHHGEIDPLINRMKYLEWARSIGSNSMDEKYFGTGTCNQIIESKSIRLFWFGVVSGEQNCRISTSVKSWTDQIERFTHSTPYREMDRIDEAQKTMEKERNF